MTFSILLVLLSLAWQEEVPFKPSDEFQLELEYTFKQKPGIDHQVFDFEESASDKAKKQSPGGPLPYLIINFKTIKLNGEEVRVKCVNNLGHLVVSKKVEVGTSFKMDLGYTDDIKDRVTAHEYNIFYLSPKKKELSRVHLFIYEDGTFLVNDEIRGKF